jgi:23S rRNA pseudouridine2605 synthase
MPQERLQKILARAGVASRRAAESYITEGRVRVNDVVVDTLGAKADPQRDKIEVQGLGILKAEPLVYIAMHKPPYVVSTVRDPEGRMTVMDVIRKSRATGKRQYEGDLPRLYPVGRLDFDAEGLILLTNDGALTQKLLHPKFHAPKTYVVKIEGRPEETTLQRLREGVRLKQEDGSRSRPTAPAEVRLVKKSPANTWVEVTVIEGRNHLIKRMFEAIRHQVLRLIRVDFGGVEIGDLPTGAWRFLTPDEVHTLKHWGEEMVASATSWRYRVGNVRDAAKAKGRSRQPATKGQVRQSTRSVSGSSKRGPRRSDNRSKVRGSVSKARKKF